MVYREKLCTLEEFLDIVRSNWAGSCDEEIRAEALKAHYWGDSSPKSNELMKWWIDSIYDGLAGLMTDQAGPVKLACLAYREYFYWGERTPAILDGRRTGDCFAQGFAPSEYRCKSSAAEVFNVIGSLDHTHLWASNANLLFDGSDFTPALSAAMFRVYGRTGAHML